MSFSQTIKQEITENELPKGCCAIAAAYAVMCFGKTNADKSFTFHTESRHIAQYIKRIFARCGIEGAIDTSDTERMYQFTVNKDIKAEKLQELFGHIANEISLRLNGVNFNCDKCVGSFISAAFLCCGTATNPEKEYMIEFVCKKHGLMQDFEALLKGHGFTPGHTVRKGLSVIYFKNSEQIEDLLTYIGATSAALEIMGRKVYKDFRNKVNRITNCENANIDKMVEANANTLSAILYLQKNKAIEILPQQLIEAAQKRVENPDLSLKELALCFEPPLSKSGLNHRFKKIQAAAKALRERNSDGRQA